MNNSILMDSAFGPGKTHCVCPIKKSLLQVLRNDHKLQSQKINNSCFFVFFKKKEVMFRKSFIDAAKATTTLKFNILFNIFTFTKKKMIKRGRKKEYIIVSISCTGGTCRG